MNNAVFGKTMENVRKHRDIKLVTTERRRNYLVSEQNYHTKKLFTKNLLVIEMKKNSNINKQACLFRITTLDLSKTAMDEFWYDFLKPKHGENAKLCYMDTGSSLFM